MLKNRIIPCLDVKNGRVVKGINFVDLKDAGDPAEQASIYSNGGADEICFLDITASNENRNTIIDVVNKTAEKCFVPLTVGGGIRTIDDIRNLLLAGADKVSINTAAVKDINFVKDASRKFGTQCMVVAVDAKKVSENKWEIFTHGGRTKTGIDAIDFAGRTALDHALIRNVKDSVCLLLKLRDDAKLPVADKTGRTTLFHAVRYADYEIVAELLKYGADPNVALPDGTTPLMIAVEADGIGKGRENIVSLF